ncbi:MAG: orotidine-5'-phosphate decarboxylase [Deltaproteobacteria bacterium]|nr:orotidine-5'-phosphate decarboxylase [Deltaproteobacteria bacterium]
MTGPARDRLCFALDVPDAPSALALVDELQDDVGVFKIGLELFVACGPAIVRDVRARGVAVFLDLKLHDIAHTVQSAVTRAVELDVRFLTVHASGGPAMLAAAAAAARGSRTTLLAVTALTSLTDDDLAAVGFAHTATTLVPRLAQLAHAAGIGGLVCSPHEVEAVKRVAPSLYCVTPGVRSAGDDKGDQARVKSAHDAVAAGADAVVVGRPIRTAPSRRDAARRFVDELAAGLAARPPARSPR